MDINNIETPCYIIDDKKFSDNCMSFEREFSNTWGNNLIFAYPVKTNHHQHFLELALQRKWYAEVVSEREYFLAIESGFNENNIILNGPIKGSAFNSVIRTNAIINLDNFEELYHLIRNKKNINCRVGIRVNFDLEKKCKGETSAGEHPSRFGICYENGDIKKAINLLSNNHIKLAGVHMHTSTKSRSKNVFYEISNAVCKLKKEFNLKLDYIDLGGGFFGGKIQNNYPLISEYANVICDTLNREFACDKTTLILEPGASVIATAVNYYVRVRSVKQMQEEVIVTVDGSNLHINPFMSDRIPNYEIVGQLGEKECIQQICGSTCMENDRMILLRNQGKLNTSNYIIFHDAGAYTMSLNNFFIHNPPKVYVKAENEVKKWAECKESL